MSRRADYVLGPVYCPTGCGGTLPNVNNICGRCGWSEWDEEKKRLAARRLELTETAYDHEFQELRYDHKPALAEPFSGV